MGKIEIKGSPYGSFLNEITELETDLKTYELNGGSATMGEIIEHLGGADNIYLTRRHIDDFCDKNKNLLTGTPHRCTYFVYKDYNEKFIIVVKEYNGYECLHERMHCFDPNEKIECQFPKRKFFVIPTTKLLSSHS